MRAIVRAIEIRGWDMRWNASGLLVPMIVSAAVSAAVAVVVTETVAPPYAGAAAGGVAAKAKPKPKPKGVSLAMLNKTVTKDFIGLQTLVKKSATGTEVTALQGQLAAQADQLSKLTTTVSTLQSALSSVSGAVSSVQSAVTSLQSGVTAATTDASQAQTVATQANQQLTTLTPIVKSTAERLYDTCGLASDLWQRSFPSQSGNSGASWTESVSGETGIGSVWPFEALARCYVSDAATNGGVAAGGILPSGFSPDDAFTAQVP